MAASMSMNTVLRGDLLRELGFAVRWMLQDCAGLVNLLFRRFLVTGLVPPAAAMHVKPWQRKIARENAVKGEETGYERQIGNADPPGHADGGLILHSLAEDDSPAVRLWIIF